MASGAITRLMHVLTNIGLRADYGRERGSGFYPNYTYDLRLLYGEDGGWHGFPDLVAST